MRAYELMVIHSGELDDAAVQEEIKTVKSSLEEVGSLESTDFWGRRRFAYEIDHKSEGYYSVYEVLAEGGALAPVERRLRLADSVVRYKVIRLPDEEAVRRGLLDGDDDGSSD